MSPQGWQLCYPNSATHWRHPLWSQLCSAQGHRIMDELLLGPGEDESMFHCLWSSTFCLSTGSHNSPTVLVLTRASLRGKLYINSPYICVCVCTHTHTYRERETERDEHWTSHNPGFRGRFPPTCSHLTVFVLTYPQSPFSSFSLWVLKVINNLLDSSILT